MFAWVVDACDVAKIPVVCRLQEKHTYDMNFSAVCRTPSSRLAAFRNAHPNEITLPLSLLSHSACWKRRNETALISTVSTYVLLVARILHHDDIQTDWEYLICISSCAFNGGTCWFKDLRTHLRLRRSACQHSR